MSRDGDRSREIQRENDADKTHPRPEATPAGMSAPANDWQSPTQGPERNESAQPQEPPVIPVVPLSAYVVGREVARGGRGRILMAYDRRLGRTVALKESLLSNPEAMERFLREALITAHLQHPSIVPVHEAGYWTTGAPFYAMKMVSGQSLQDVIEKTRTPHRLALLPNMIAVAEAIAYAHSEGIIHRDLKPANVLIGAFGETVVVDWGLAKELSAPKESSEPLPAYAGGRSDLTVIGSVIGTPAYMAPEQARGLPADQRGDVYALGAMLFHVLAGVPPYSGMTGAQVLQKVAAGSPPPSLEQLQLQVPADLSAIVAKAMAPNSADRYPTAAELAADLKRFQTGQLVYAHVYSIRSLVRRWVSRHRATVTVASILLAILAATAIVSVQRVVRERNRAEARTNDMILIQARSLLETDPSSAIAWLKTYPANAPAWGAVRVIAEDALERGVAKRVFRGHRDQVHSAVFTPDGKRVVSASMDKTVRVWDVDTDQVRVLSGHKQIVVQVAASPDNRTIASASNDKTIRLWDLDTGNHRVLSGHGGEVSSVAFSPDGKLLASASWDHTVRLWEIATGEGRILAGPRKELPEGSDRQLIGASDDPLRIQYVSFSPNGQALVSASVDGTVWLWDVASGERRLLTKHSKPVNVAPFSPDGVRVLTCSDDMTMQLWDLTANEHWELKSHSGGVNRASFSPDGERIASASEDGTVRLWDAQGRLIQTLTGHQGSVRSVAFSPDGHLLASGSTDNTVRLWNLVTGETRVLRGHTSPIAKIEFSPAGNAVLSASWDNTVRLWDLQASSSIVFQGDRPMRSAAFSPDGHLLAFGGDDGTVRLWDRASSQTRELHGHEKRINRLVFAPKQHTLASASEDRTVRIWDLPEGQPRVFEGHEDGVKAMAFMPDGKALISASWDKTVRIWDRSSGSSRALKGHKDGIDDLAVSPDGMLVASAGRDSTVLLWNLVTQKTDTLEHERRVYRVAFSGDGRWLASGSDTVRLWDVRTGQATILAGHDLPVVDLAFFKNNRLASGARDKRLIVWDLSSGASSIFVGHPSPVNTLAIAPEGRRLASASWDLALNLSTVRLWDIETHESRKLPGNTNEVNSLTFSPDGTAVVAASSDGSVRLWRDDLPTEPNALHAWMDRVTDATLERQ